tara:strand:- start:105 stop:287 length:183 start_codon:yes stop_codon:yes gene_type:complete
MATSKPKKKGKKKVKDLKISRYKDPRSRPGLYYGSDGLKKIRLPNGEIRWVETDVHPTRT